MSKNRSTQVVPPGSWLGVFGGGQLGRMFTHAAQQMGYHVAIFESEVGSPAAQAADRHFCDTTSDQSTEELVDEMAELCEAVTLEFENIPAELVRRAAVHTHARPNADFLEMCQDRIREKSSLSAAGFPTTPFERVTNPDEVRDAARRLGWPLVLKTARSGYDGKGQGIVRDEQELSPVWASLDCPDVIAEKWIEFDAEVSMLAARNASGQIECYPLLENDHANHILDVTRCPASDRLRRLESTATEICRGVAEQFQVVGLFCIEFFVSASGELMINEIAPRPHNSGHLTIEAFGCSQFEQQVRAICNLPLIPAQQIRPAAMANLLGDLWQGGEPNWLAALDCPSAHLHLYGKGEPRAARKMGHLTVVQEEHAAETAVEIRARMST